MSLTFDFSIPAKSWVNYLPEALESLRRQNQKVQIALLDASCDRRIPQMVAPYEDLIGYRYHRARDGGQSAAIQEGWNNLNGDIVAWLNDDDHLFPGALDAVAEAFEANEDIDVFYGHAVYLDPAGAFEGWFPSITSDVSRLPESNVICQPACFVRRKAMERVGGVNVSLNYVMDWDLWLRLYEAGCRFAMLNVPLAVVRNNPQTKTNTGAMARRKEIDEVLRRNHGHLVRLRSRVGFLRFDSASQGRVVLHKTVSAALTVARLLRGGDAPTGTPILGMDPVTGLIERGCQVPMTWFGDRPAAAVTVVTQGAADLEIRLDNQVLELSPGTGRYTAKLPDINRSDYLFSLESKQEAWQLRSLALS